ncbi:hypothetical protein TcasGA2_TC009859 [Tribolium castaneum]|uniref:Uncharacterized protein n=1 Tax=Tribolium castaneum TaxID=7070 RepID=D6WQ24_TRICA|nr:hypothetical protein TcasGA2_TC009859 [Tribolium castaneum]
MKLPSRARMPQNSSVLPRYAATLLNRLPAHRLVLTLEATCGFVRIVDPPTGSTFQDGFFWLYTQTGHRAVYLEKNPASACLANRTKRQASQRPRRLSRRCCVNLNIENDSHMIDTSKRPPVSTLTTVSVLSVTIAFLSRM